MNYDYSKLKGRIIEKYDSQRSFAEAIGKTQTTTSFKINGKASWKDRKSVV